MAIVYLGLGTNLGDRRANLSSALAALAQLAEIQACSRVYETAPMHVVDQPAFLNMAVRIATLLPPLSLLNEAKAMEKRLGRVDGLRYGPRLIDMDILLYDDLVMDSETLTIPHPRLTERRFALAPLADVGGLVIHPVENRTIAQLLAALPPDDEIHMIGDFK